MVLIAALVTAGFIASTFVATAIANAFGINAEAAAQIDTNDAILQLNATGNTQAAQQLAQADINFQQQQSTSDPFGFGSILGGVGSVAPLVLIGGALLLLRRRK